MYVCMCDITRYNPAWMLLDETKERSSRLKKSTTSAKTTRCQIILYKACYI
jgi:hypothetical protein